MVLAVSNAASLVLNGVTYAASVKVSLTLPGGVYPDVSIAVSDLTITSAKATDGPDGSSYQVGWPSMSADFTLSGLVDKTDATKTAAWLFGRWQTTSPLYRTDALLTAVTIDVVLGIPGATETIRKFTGYVSYYKRVGSQVQVTCSDRSILLRKSSAAIPAVATASPWNAGLTSEYAMDAVARVSTGGVVSSWPKQRPNCVLAVGFRSSLWPEVGTLQTSVLGYEPHFTTGRFGTAYAGLGPTAPGTARVWPLNSTISGDSVTTEGWIDCGNVVGAGDQFQIHIGNDAARSNEGVILRVTSTGVQVGVLFGPAGSAAASFAPTVSVALGSTIHYIGVRWTWAQGATTWTASVRVDGTTSTITAQTVANARSAGFLYGTALLPSDLSGSIEGWLTSSESSPSWNDAFTPTAVLDPSLNTLQVVPGIDAGADPRALLATTAAAELGNISFDETGVLRFVNRRNWVGTTVARTVTAQNLAALSEETTSASVINHAQVGFTGWTTQSAATVWSLTRPWRIPARSTGRNAYIRYVTLPNVTVNVDTSVSAYPLIGSGTAGRSYYAASLDKAGANPHPGLTITPTAVGSQRVKLRIDNPTAQDAYLVSPYTVTGLGPGTPTLIIGGQPVTQDTEAIADYQYPAEDDGGAASSRFGEQLWASTGNAWVQDDATAQQLVTDIVADCSVPRPNLTDLAITPPDPRIQGGDLLHAQDAVTTIVDEFVRVVGWVLAASASGWSQSVDARALSAPGGWIGGLAGRSEGGTTTYGN